MADPLKLKLEIPILLPDAAEAEDRCVYRLVETLKAREGVAEVHVDRSSAETDARLCIHYDPQLISVHRVQELALVAGAQLTERYGHLLLPVTPLHARAARTLTANVTLLPGVVEAEVSSAGLARIEFDREQVTEAQLRSSLQSLGFPADSVTTTVPPRASAPATLQRSEPGEHDHEEDRSDKHEHRKGDGHGHEGPSDHAHAHGGGPFGERSELVFSLLAGTLLLAGWLLERQGAVTATVATGIFITSYLFGGYFTLREAIGNIRAKRFEIDSLMLVAAIGAAALGRWAEGALLLFLFSLGHSLEHYAMGRARRAIEALADLAPERAVVRRNGGTEEVAVAALAVGDIVIVRPNERLPADGVVVAGESSVNQAPVTGESVPVEKRPVGDVAAALAAFEKVGAEHRVFAGTINGAGAIDVAVAKPAGESTMARVARMVQEAQAQRSPTQNFTDKFERVFVPVVLVLVVILLFAWVVVDEPFSASFYRAMAVLVAASPCALAISVPSAVLSGIARAGRGGVLIKGGGPLENLGTLTAIAFDKTGTLTEGKPRVTDIVAAEGATESELLTVALAVEEQSDHPLASAIVTAARERLNVSQGSLVPSAVESITGRGVKAVVEGQTVHIGKPVLFGEISGPSVPSTLAQANERLVNDGRTTLIVRQGERYLGVIGVMDTPRPAAKEVMVQLQKLGITQLIMISGDNQRVADAVAKAVGLTEARGDLMPEDKVEAIKEFRASAGKVAMVGDGVNDAPAMANATVGIAMGAAGSDVALETADVALMSDDLRHLPFAVGLSRRTSSVIRQNLWVSLGVVAVLIPATIFGLSIGTAVIFHEGSTLLVVANALRLLAYDVGSNK